MIRISKGMEQILFDHGYDAVWAIVNQLPRKDKALILTAIQSDKQVRKEFAEKCSNILASGFWAAVEEV